MDAEKMSALLNAVRDANAEAHARREELEAFRARARAAGEASLAADKALADYLSQIIGDRGNAYPI